MKYLPNFLLTVTALALLAANWQVFRHRRSAPAVPLGIEGTVDTAKAIVAASDSATAAAPPQAEVAAQAVNATSQPHHSTVAFDWAQVESSDYKHYVRALREIGFPEELVRSIVTADIDKLYEPLEQAFKPKLVPYDAPLSQRQTHDISPADWQRVTDLWNLRVHKQGALEEILGEYVPREILRSPISLNYEALEYAISQLPVEKRNAVQLAVETEILVEGMNKTSINDRAAELEAFKKSREDRDATLRQILTPEEFERYEMNTTPAGTELARRVIGMQPTDQEFTTMFRIAYKNWLDTGGVYGRWRALPVPRAQIAAADAEMNASLNEALGQDRFLDYQMAVSDTGQKMRNFGARFEVPRETLAQAFDLQTQIDRLSRVRSPAQSPIETMAQLQDHLQQVLGPNLWQAWQEGRNLQVSLDP